MLKAPQLGVTPPDSLVGELDTFGIRSGSEGTQLDSSLISLFIKSGPKHKASVSKNRRSSLKINPTGVDCSILSAI